MAVIRLASGVVPLATIFMLSFGDTQALLAALCLALMIAWRMAFIVVPIFRADRHAGSLDGQTMEQSMARVIRAKANLRMPAWQGWAMDAAVLACLAVAGLRSPGWPWPAAAFAVLFLLGRAG